jgi:hypothetical protein
MKPVYSALRLQGFTNLGYIDDSFLTEHSRVDCLRNVLQTVKLLNDLGFFIHPTKSVLMPSQLLEFLGFMIDSLKMIVYLSRHKKDDISKLCSETLLAESLTIRHLASVIGKLTSCFPGVQYGPFHYRCLQYDKNAALRQNKGNFDRLMVLSENSKSELRWWIENIHHSYKDIVTEPP